MINRKWKKRKRTCVRNLAS